MGLCDGKVVIVTGAGRGLGRAHALTLAAEGAAVVVNDIGGTVHGEGADASLAQNVGDEITGLGGVSVADTSDVADFEGAARLVARALETFGRLDAVVNNAGILRDRMLFNATPDDWDAVVRVHLRSTFAVTHHAVRHWRELAKRGDRVDARVVCTTSPSGLYGNPGQANYAAAKAGIVGFVLTLAQELERYGVAVNALSPGARTRMTDGLFDMDDGGEVDLWAPENVAPALAWLLSDDAAGLTGTVLEVENGWVGLALPWMHGPRRRLTDRWWTAADVADAMPELLAEYRALRPAEEVDTP
jgi:NAD(P)-dependent dehydrogenase (short-subunit alcohol dehydrogenase family)